MIIVYILCIIYLIMFIVYLTIQICYHFYFERIVGWFGEHWVRKELKKLPSNQYKVLNNLLLESNGYTHQIDHIVVSQFGIFVIETKQYNGSITGNKYDKKWIKKISKNKEKYYENPIRQNYGHVKAICELLNLDENKVFNIACIPSTAKLKVENDGELTRIYTIIERIKSHNEIVLPNYNEYFNSLVKSNIVDRKKRKEHIIYAQKVKDYYDSKCPKCGGDLVKRSGLHGEFYGCSNYPRCRYTNKLNK